MRQRIENFLRDILPEGPFWVSAAAETFVRALAGAVEPVASFADGLRDAVYPGTAERPVLLAWWDFVRIECSETPADTEALRAAVLSALGSPPGHTIAGLRALVRGQGLEHVELRHRLPVSRIPSTVPFPVDPHARVLEVWNSPRLHSDDRVRCVVRAFAQAADTLRFVAPTSRWKNLDVRADKNAFFWTYCPQSSALFERSNGGPVIESVQIALPTEHGRLRADEVFAVAPGESLEEERITWVITRSFDGVPVVIDQGQHAEIA